MFTNCSGLAFFNTVSEDHDQAGLCHHVLVDVSVVTLKYHHCLLARNPLAHVALIVPSVVLSRFQRVQTWWPTALVAVIHQVIDDVRWAPRLIQGPSYHRLQKRPLFDLKVIRTLKE